MRSRYVSYVLLSEKKIVPLSKKNKKDSLFCRTLQKNAIFAVILLL